MSLRDIRLRSDLDGMLQLNQWSSFIEVFPIMSGEVANEYNVIFHCKGVVDRSGTVGENHKVEIYLPADYPRVPPVAKVLTPIFHPNIASVLQNSRNIEDMFKQLDREPDRRKREQTLQRLRQNKDLQRASICLDILEMNWAPSLPLYLVCVEIGEMIQYKRVNPEHALNQEAGAWAHVNRHLLPIDGRALLDKRPTPTPDTDGDELISIDLTLETD